MTRTVEFKSCKESKNRKRSEKSYHGEIFHDWNLYASNSASSFSLCCSSYNSFICSTFHKMSTTSTKFRQHAKNFQNLLSRCKQNQKLLDKMTITFGAHLFDSFSQVWKPFNIPLNKTLHCFMYIVVLSLSMVGCIMRIVQGLASLVMQSFQRHNYRLSVI